jgi:hypothetical protein
MVMPDTFSTLIEFRDLLGKTRWAQEPLIELKGTAGAMQITEENVSKQSSFLVSICPNRRI